MSYRTILAVIDGTVNDYRVLEAALAVGRPCEARITALYADTDPSELPAAYVGDGAGVYLSQDLWEALEAQIGEQRDLARAHFEDWKHRGGLRDAVEQTAGLTARLVVETGRTTHLLAKHGPVTDLIVTALRGPGEVGPGMIGRGIIGRDMALEAALFDTGRPALAIPATGATTVSQGAPIVIAWNGKPEAARALAGALPFLASSRGEVIVLTAVERDVSRPLAPVIDYLARHGVAARGVELAGHDGGHDGGTGALLLDEAAKRGAGLLVMGAYTHNRWREVVLGGVTRHVLKHAALPILLAH